MWERIREKLTILADAAKYDVSCSSSGSKRANDAKGLGNTNGMGICHTYTQDGRCVSLLKVLLTNVCIYDCLYCVSRRSNDVKRVGFTVDEVIELTINFYRRNYIEGLFLSSGIFKSADYTMERLVRVVKRLREEHRFNGYIHLKAIPGASTELIKEAGLYADRLSVNLELPSASSLKLLAPEKKYDDIVKPMSYVKDTIVAMDDERKQIKKAPSFIPAGQSSQLVVGASPENDYQVMRVANELYSRYALKRVYYSGYVPVSSDNRLPALGSPVPVIRENRLYQADWLMRFYGFSVHELIDQSAPWLDLQIDPKLAWALRHPEYFPVDVNTADYHQILRIPGVGVSSAKKIIQARRFRRLGWDQLKEIGISFHRAKYFMICASTERYHRDIDPSVLRSKVLPKSKFEKSFTSQLQLFAS
jgi:putative DNA modification/repair radical SAM protein